MGGNRRVTIITPVKARNRTSSTTQRAIPVYFTSIKNKGVRRAMEYASKVSLENTRLREREKILQDRLKTCKEEKKVEKKKFQKMMTAMVARMEEQENRLENVRKVNLLLNNDISKYQS